MRLAFVAPAGGASASGPASGGYLYDARLAEAVRQLGHEVVEIDLPAAHDAPAIARLASSLVGFDAVLEDELGFEALLALNAALRASAPAPPAVAVVHVPAPLLAEDPRPVPEEAAFLRGVSAAIFVSRATLNDTARLYGPLPRSRVVAPGIDHFVPRPARPSGPLHIVVVGHVLPNKDALGFCDVLEDLSARVSGVFRATWAGALDVDPVYVAAVRERLARSPIGDRVTLAGRLSPAEVADLLAGAYVFASPSRYESYGIAATEALASSVPVVTWTSGGLAEIVRDGVGGVVVPRGDVAAFGAALASLADPSVHASLAEGARTVAADLPTWSASARRLEAVLAEVVGR